MLLKRHGFEQHLYFWRSKACNFALQSPLRITQKPYLVDPFGKNHLLKTGTKSKKDKI